MRMRMVMVTVVTTMIRKLKILDRLFLEFSSPDGYEIPPTPRCTCSPSHPLVWVNWCLPVKVVFGHTSSSPWGVAALEKLATSLPGQALLYPIFVCLLSG